jgi:serine/threonine protein kinase
VALTSVQLWERIHAEKLATSEECRQWAIAVAQATSQEVLLDPSRLAAELIKQGRITSFQANVLFHGLGIPLVLDGFRLTKSLEAELGKGWFEAESGSSPTSTKYWLYHLTLSALNTPEVRRNPPSLRLASRTISMQHPSLDRWSDAKVTDSKLFAVCNEILGQPLSTVLKTSRLSWDDSTSMIEQIAAGLGKQHEAGLVHGRIHTSTVWALQDGTFVLRRDPFFPASNPQASNDLSCLGEIHGNLLSTAAPELTLPASSPTIQSDLYALGCLWYASSSNEPLFEASNRAPRDLSENQALWARAHTTENLADRFDRNVPERFRFCLAKLLAKNPSDRFDSARSLFDAIDQALRAPASPKPTPVVASTPIVDKRADSKALSEVPPKQAQIAKPEPKLPKPKPTVAKLPEVTQPVTKAPTPPAPAATAPTAKPNQVKNEAPEVRVAAASNVAPKQPELPKAPALAKETAVPKEAVFVEEIATSVVVNDDANAAEAGFLKPTEADASEPAAKPKRKKRGPGKKSGASPASGPGSAVKKKKSKKKKPKWLLPAMVAGTCLLFATLIPLLLLNGSSTQPVDPNPTTVVIERTRPPQDSSNVNAVPSSDAGNNKPSQPVDPVAEYYSVNADDGKTLWAPPQAGSPYSIEMLPAGLEAIVFLSGNAWHQRGSIAGLGKWWQEIQPQISGLVAKYPMLSDDRIESVGIALYPGKTAGVPQVLFRVKLKQPTALETIANGLQGFSAQLLDTKSGSKRGIWSNEASNDPSAIAFEELATDLAATTKRFTVGPQELVLGLSELQGGVAPLRRQLEQLLQSTDSRADVTVLFAPSFLFGDGRELISTWPNLSPMVRDIMDESTQAVSISMFFESQWYLELRMLNAETRESGRILSQLKARLEKLPDQMEAAILESPSHPYWRALSQRYPQMLRSLGKFGRFGIEDGQVIANVYLPKEAASNLLIASWMAMAAPPATGVSTSSTSGTKPAAKPQTKSIDAILDSPISISFGQESLESALQLISSEVADSVLSGESFPMAINGTAFQKQGITQNQQIRDFKQASVPLRTVLTDLVRRANPVTTVQSATEKDQKVVWVVIDDPNTPAKKKIELTTRTWAETNNVKLTSEFVAP